MARKGKPVDDFEDDQTGDKGDAQAQGGFDDADDRGIGDNSDDDGVVELTRLAEQAKPLLEAHAEQQSEIDAIMEEARERCQPYRDEQKAIIKAAAEGRDGRAGVPKKVFRSLITCRRYGEKQSLIPTKLNEDDRELYTPLVEALGADFMRTPLGEAAAAAEA
ncbi:MAG: hypothetical protein GC155_06140 [Alphaproteobacteria bacterium]|nr:hypothetical protein [Alphaproteobacteria bacterium]